MSKDPIDGDSKETASRRAPTGTHVNPLDYEACESCGCWNLKTGVFRNHYQGCKGAIYIYDTVSRDAVLGLIAQHKSNWYTLQNEVRELPVPTKSARAERNEDLKLYERLLKLLVASDGDDVLAVVEDIIKQRDEVTKELEASAKVCDALRRELEQARKDAERLNFLDAVNAESNKRNGTTYGWRFEVNHNRAALTDHNLPALSVRGAIDAAAEKGSEG